MRFDDRLLTVLNQPAEDRHDVAVRWRQLVDLIARNDMEHDSAAVQQALAAIRDEASSVDEALRAAAARSIAALPLPMSLLEYFASEKLAVAAPILAAANLAAVDWQRLQVLAHDETRAFIASLNPAVAAPPSTAEPISDQTPSEEPYTPPSLPDVVQRIERRRQMRVHDATELEAAPLPAEAPALFRWECDPGGEIAWVDGAPRGALIGRSIARSHDKDGDRIDRELEHAFAMRAPFRDAAIVVAGGGAVSGEWKFSGIPAFDPSNGRFAGYRGVALREALSAPRDEPAAIPEVLADPASLRELVHEIKTPLNAIIGFAEIIEGQYLGPADRGYRDRAAEIVQQARLLLTAIDDLDFAAKLHSASPAVRQRVDLGELLHREMDEIRRKAAVRGVQIAVIRERQQVAAAVQPELADRLIFRLFDLLIELAGRQERLEVGLDTTREGARLSISRPARMAATPNPLDRTVESEGAFALRLVRGLARIAGGNLRIDPSRISLVFPLPQT